MVANAAPLILRFGALVIDLEQYLVFLNGRPLRLTYREYALLITLAGQAGQIVSKRRLLEEGLGRHDTLGLRMVDETIRHLKNQIEPYGMTYIEAAGEGYRFVPNGGA